MCSYSITQLVQHWIFINLISELKTFFHFISAVITERLVIETSFCKGIFIYFTFCCYFGICIPHLLCALWCFISWAAQRKFVVCCPYRPGPLFFPISLELFPSIYSPQCRQYISAAGSIGAVVKFVLQFVGNGLQKRSKWSQCDGDLW